MKIRTLVIILLFFSVNLLSAQEKIKKNLIVKIPLLCHKKLEIKISFKKEKSVHYNKNTGNGHSNKNKEQIVTPIETDTFSFQDQQEDESSIDTMIEEKTKVKCINCNSLFGKKEKDTITVTLVTIVKDSSLHKKEKFFKRKWVKTTGIVVVAPFIAAYYPFHLLFGKMKDSEFKITARLIKVNKFKKTKLKKNKKKQFKCFVF